MKLINKRLIFYGLFIAQLLFVVITWYSARSAELSGSEASRYIALGGLFGLMAGFFFLYQMILIGGNHLYEKYFGLDRLARLHHYNGFLGYFFLIAHVFFIITGYSAASGNQFIDELNNLRNILPYVDLAVISLLIFDVIILSSFYIVRRKLKYEYWYFIHLMVYAAVLLALFHQVTNGQTLLAEDYLKWYWYALYALAFGLVLSKRWFLPIFYEFRHRFRVERVEKENKNVTSIYVSGKNIDKFNYQAGQFNLWQIWQKGFRTMHHPFTISSSPDEDNLRFSAKAIGDYTKKLPDVKKGSPVLIGGPYGIFTKQLQAKPKRLFIAGGIGITPIRSILNDEVKSDDVLLYASQTLEDAVFKDELKIMQKDGLRLVHILSEQKSKNHYQGYINEEILRKEVSDINQRDIWLVGPPSMMESIKKILRKLKVDKNSIHTEEFRL